MDDNEEIVYNDKGEIYTITRVRKGSGNGKKVDLYLLANETAPGHAAWLVDYIARANKRTENVTKSRNSYSLRLYDSLEKIRKLRRELRALKKKKK